LAKQMGCQWRMVAERNSEVNGGLEKTFNAQRPPPKTSCISQARVDGHKRRYRFCRAKATASDFQN
jgi:hypothetical protein